MSNGHIRRRSEGSWELKYDAGHDPITGKRITKFKTVRGTKRDAERELRTLLSAVDNGMYADAGKLTLGAWLDKWLAARRHSIAPKTAERYGELIAKHISPNIGATALGKVTTLLLNEFYVDRLTRGRLDGKGGLSAQTVRHMDRASPPCLPRRHKGPPAGAKPDGLCRAAQGGQKAQENAAG